MSISLTADRLVNLRVEGHLKLSLEFPPKHEGGEPRQLPVHSGGSLIWPGVKLIIEERVP